MFSLCRLNSTDEGEEERHLDFLFFVVGVVSSGEEDRVVGEMLIEGDEFG